MTQPEEIRALRTKYGLTQGELSKLLGWGAATLSRYENGALQDEAHEKVLRLATDPRNLLKLIQESPGVLSETKCNRLVEQLRTAEEEACSFPKIYEDRFGRYQADALSGYRKLDLSKLFDAILFFCKEPVFKTVLNKLLFYADFKHFKEYKISITGARYARVPYGPAPDKWDHYYAFLKDEELLSVDEVFYKEDVGGEKLTAETPPDLNRFSEDELGTLMFVKRYFRGWKAKQISDFSHNEKGYLETPTGRLISYSHADDLQI